MVWIEKSVTRDHCSASLGKPRDADQWPWWQIFLSTPYTHERYLYAKPEDIVTWSKYLSFRFRIKEFIIFFSGCLDLSANLLICYMVLVRNVQ